MSVISDYDEACWASSQVPNLRQLITKKIWEMIGSEYGDSFHPKMVHEKAFKKHRRFGRFAEELRDLERFECYPIDEELVKLFVNITILYSRQM